MKLLGRMMIMKFPAQMRNRRRFTLRLLRNPAGLCDLFLESRAPLWSRSRSYHTIYQITVSKKSSPGPAKLLFSLNRWFGLLRPWLRRSTICCSRWPRERGRSWARASSWGPPPCCWTRWSKGPSSWRITCSRRTSCRRTLKTSVSISSACALHNVILQYQACPLWCLSAATHERSGYPITG